MSGPTRADGGTAADELPRTGRGPGPEGEGAPAAPAGQGAAPGVSVVVPVTERPEPLGDLYREYAEGLQAAGLTTEFIFVAPAWRGDELSPLRDLREDGEPVRVVEVGGEITEAGLLKAGADRAQGNVLLTLPAYYRVEAAALPGLVDVVERGDADLAVARRSPRRDPWINRLQNRAFHGLLRVLVGSTVSDTGCGVRAMRPEVIEDVPLYGDFYRFLPVLASREGFRVQEVDARQHEKDADPRVYGPGTYVRRLVDLLGVFFLSRFTYKPLRFFGLVGSVLGAAGAGVLAVVFVQRVGGQALADRPLLVLGVLLATLGLQAFALGLVGEIIVHFNISERPGYRVVEDTGGEG